MAQMVRIGAVEGIEKLTRDLGANPIAVIDEVGLSDPQFRDPNTYIAYAKFAELLGRCAAACGEPYFGLLLAQRQSIDVLGDLPLIAARAETVGDALETINRYLYLHASGVRLDRTRVRDDVALGLSIEIGNPPGYDQVMQLSVGHLAIFVAGLLDRDPFTLPLELRQPAPGISPAPDTLRFRRVAFSAKQDGVTLPASWLEKPNHQDEAALTGHLENYLKQLQGRYPDRLPDQVRDLISRLLPSGECSVERVARTLNMHPRSLQEKLRVLGTSYRALLEEVRRDLAIQHLNRHDVTVTDLALQLGYAEIAVFSRHFKRWTGLSPRAWQRAHQRQVGVVEWLR